MQTKNIKINIKSRINKIDVGARKDVLSKSLQGEWSTSFKGRGMEFAGFREYQYGDDASSIDWRASLRSKSVLIREFEDYKNFNIFFVLDVSDSMFFSSHDVLKCEFAAEVVYVLADAINKAGDGIGIALANEVLVAKTMPNIGSDALGQLRATLLRTDLYGGLFDFKKAVLSTKALIGSGAVMIVVSDFFNLGENWERYVHMLSVEFELIALVIRDPRDRFMPKGVGQVLLKDPVSGENVYVDTNKIREKYNEDVRKQEEYLENVFKKSRGDYLLLETNDDDYIRKLIDFFQRRAKRSD